MSSKSATKPLDKAIDQVFLQLDREAELQKTSTRARAALGKQNLKDKVRDWSEEERRILREQIVQLGAAGVAELVGRTANAVKIQQVRMGLKGPTRNEEYFTANTAADALGIDIHAVTKLMRMGLLALERAPVPGYRPIFRIKRKDLLAWAVNPMQWPYWLYNEQWKVRRIPDPAIARMVALRRKRWGDEWLSIGQVARMFGVHHTQINLAYIERGRFRGRKLKFRNWIFLRSDVLAENVPIILGKGSAEGDWTPGGNKFMLLSIACGMSEQGTCAMMKKNEFNWLFRLKALHRRGQLRPLAKELGIELRRIDGDWFPFADWRLYKHRFPALTRAAFKFRDARRLSGQERLLIKRVLYWWASHFAKTPAQRKTALGWKFAGRNCSEEALRKRYAVLLSWGINPFHGLRKRRSA